METFYIIKDSLQPHYEKIAKDRDGEVIDISSAAVFFRMTNPKDGTVVTSAAAVVDSGTLGAMRYAWAASDTAVAGIYVAQFEVWSLSAGRYIMPEKPSEDEFVIVRG